MPAQLRSSASSAVEWLRAWWRVDRIRVSPDEGRLYRLRPGWIVRVGDCAAQVEQASVSGPHAGDGGGVVIYRCRDADGREHELRVTQPHPAAPPVIEWDDGGAAHRLAADDVIVLPARLP